jgi:cell division septation protein DedD
VTETQIVRGYSPADAAWKVDVNVVDTRDEAQALATRLRGAGFDPSVERVTARAQDDPRPGPVGFLVRLGSFSVQADADALRALVVAAGFTTARTVFTPENGARGRPTDRRRGC